MVFIPASVISVIEAMKSSMRYWYPFATLIGISVLFYLTDALQSFDHSSKLIEKNLLSPSKINSLSDEDPEEESNDFLNYIAYSCNQ